MLHVVLSTKIRNEKSIPAIRDRTRQVGELFGLSSLERTRLVTAVSEIVRNVVNYAGTGTISFLAGDATQADGVQSLVVQISDEGPGIAHLDELLASTQRQSGSSGMGIVGSRRLVDAFSIQSTPHTGTQVWLEMVLQRRYRFSAVELTSVIDALVKTKSTNPLEELEQQNREMLHTLEELRRRQLALEEADERKNEFLAMLAHELRNPLSTISMSTELMRRRPVLKDEDVRVGIGLISRQVGHLTKLVSDLMDVSRITQGKVALDKTTLDVNQLVKDAVEMTQAAVAGRQHTLTVHTDGVPLYIEADAVRMRQVLSNLIHNAARYTPSGGKIDVSVLPAVHTVAIEIADNGSGISAAMLPRVFDLFAQADSGLARQDTGLGIGLTIVQRMVRDHGGSVQAFSAGLGHGSRFTIVLPLSLAPRADTHVHALRPNANAASRRILLIDDNEQSVDNLANVLRLNHHECMVAHSGEAGLLAAGTFCPDVAIVDIGLPGMDGFQVAQALRDAMPDASLKLIALSGYSSEAFAERGRQAGFDRFLVKPADVDMLLAILNESCAPIHP